MPVFMLKTKFEELGMMQLEELSSRIKCRTFMQIQGERDS